jgi:hypothetical protein
MIIHDHFQLEKQYQQTSSPSVPLFRKNCIGITNENVEVNGQHVHTFVYQEKQQKLQFWYLVLLHKILFNLRLYPKMNVLYMINSFLSHLYSRVQHPVAHVLTEFSLMFNSTVCNSLHFHFLYLLFLHYMFRPM